MLLSLKTRSFRNRYPRWIVGPRLLYTTCVFASLGDAMFGFGEGVISTIQVHPTFIERMYGSRVTLQDVQRGNTGVSPYLQAIVGSSLNIAAIVASLISAHLCDTLGRRLTIRLGALLYTLASLIQIFVPSLSSFLVGRVIQGLAAGTLLTAIPIFQCEIAPAGKRGMFVGIEYMFMTIGYAVASWIGFGLLSSAATAPRESEMAWRGLFIIQLVLGLMLGVSTFYIPESPRWLIQHGHPTQAIQVLADLHGTGNFDDAIILQSFTEIETAIQLETKGGQALHAGWRDLFGAYKKRGLVANASQQFTQSNGINAVLFFLVDNLLRAGFKLDKAALYAAGCAMVLCAGTVVNVVCVDRVGRRPLLITGGIGLSIAVAVIGAMQFIVDAEEVSSGVLRLAGARGILGFMCVYLFVFGATWGPTPRLLAAEVFPMRARAKGMAFAMVVNWLTDLILAFATPPLFSAIHGGFYYVLLASCASSAGAAWLLFPKTGGKSLEGVGEAFGEPGVDDAAAGEGEKGESGVPLMEKGKSDGSTDVGTGLAYRP